MPAFNDEALDALRLGGYLRGTTQADRARLTRDLGLMHVAQHVQTDQETEVQEKGIWPPEARKQLLGTIDDEEARRQLDGLFAELTRADGAVQLWLNSNRAPGLDGSDGDDDEDGENGHKDRYYLCSARGTRTFPDANGEPKTISVIVRFATANDVQIERYAAQPELIGLERSAGRAHRRFDRMVTVAPALEQRKQLWLNDANARVQRELPPTTEQAA